MCWYSNDNYTNNNETQHDNGRFGNYDCDAPFELVLSALQFMKIQQPNPDFIVWTGDDDSHVSDSYFSPTIVQNIMGIITTAINNTFPNTNVIPTFGNHDAFPKSQFAPRMFNNWYVEIADLWKNWLGEEAYETFKIGGYFKVPHPMLNNVTIIGLNTAIYYVKNDLVNDTMDGDPLEQLLWLDETLTELSTNHSKAYITAHIPPGVFGYQVLPMGRSWFQPRYNKEFIDLIIKHSDIIIGQFYGHEHTDSFRLFYDSEGIPVNALFVAPAVSPRKSKSNPSVRLFSYNLTTGEILNYEQYYLNLTEANALETAEWELKYDFLSAFNLSNMSYESINQLTQNFAIENNTNFYKYLDFNSYYHHRNIRCSPRCQRNHFCSITQVDYQLFAQCNANVSVVTRS
ncbi:Acid sphingomyelinase-like phosphodiesterase 3b, variant 2 [Chamberlinius hualienensis]